MIILHKRGKTQIIKNHTKSLEGGRLLKKLEERRNSAYIQKGDKNGKSNYRDITLINTVYKIYAMIIEERLKQELEKNKVLVDIQAGFRKNRSTMDNIYILNYAVEKKISKKERKVYAFFVDLKAAFDIVNREKLRTIMKRKEINRHLIKKIEEIYEETVNTVLVSGTYTKEFCTNIGVRQGCPLSPTLFEIYIADIEEVLNKGQTGVLVINKEKIWSLGYADIVLMAKEANDMREMLKRISSFLEKIELNLSAKKSKMTFRKGEREGRKNCGSGTE